MIALKPRNRSLAQVQARDLREADFIRLDSVVTYRWVEGGVQAWQPNAATRHWHIVYDVDENAEDAELTELRDKLAEAFVLLRVSADGPDDTDLEDRYVAILGHDLVEVQTTP